MDKIKVGYFSKIRGNLQPILRKSAGDFEINPFAIS